MRSIRSRRISTALVPLDSWLRLPTFAPWVLSVWLAFQFVSCDLAEKNVWAEARVVTDRMGFPVLAS